METFLLNFKQFLVTETQKESQKIAKSMKLLSEKIAEWIKSLDKEDDYFSIMLSGKN